jgi:hypothetical protein
MANLSGQTIQSTFPGLLNLATATTGITSTYQQIQDGLGNNTNTRISTQGILSPNLPSLNNLKPDFGGSGFGTAGVTPVASTQNRTLYQLFYDTGLYSYSAITYNVSTATTSSDVVTVAFYSLQLVPTVGIAPKDLIMSGITLISNSTGLKTTTLPSTLSFSGTGGGYYIMAVIITNGGVTPTIRYTNNNGFNSQTTSYGTSLGLYLQTLGTNLTIGHKQASVSNQLFTLNNLSSFQTSYSTSDITTNIATTVITGGLGFGLNVI